MSEARENKHWLVTIQQGPRPPETHLYHGPDAAYYFARLHRSAVQASRGPHAPFSNSIAAAMDSAPPPALLNCVEASDMVAATWVGLIMTEDNLAARPRVSLVPEGDPE